MTVRRSKKTNRPRVVDSRTRKTRYRRDNQQAGDLKSTITGFFIWFLVVINVILTASFIFRIVNKQPLPPARKDVEERLIEVEVLNGCGVGGLAKEIADFLRSRGFDVKDYTNADNWDYPRTMIVDRTSEAGNNAMKVASTLGLEEDAVIVKLSTLRKLDVTLIIGKDYRKLNLYR